MKNLIPLLLAFILVSCGAESVEKVETKKEVKTSNETKVSHGDFSNPAIIYGTDFLTFFKSLRKMGKVDEMVKFTSSKSVEKYGKEALKDYYANKFTNMSNSKLKSLTVLNDSAYAMNYINSEFATKRAFDVKVVIENDSTKLVLEEKYPFK